MMEKEPGRGDRGDGGGCVGDQHGGFHAVL